VRCSFEAIVEDYHLPAPGLALGLDRPCGGRQGEAAGGARRDWFAGVDGLLRCAPKSRSSSLSRCRDKRITELRAPPYPSRLRE